MNLKYLYILWKKGVWTLLITRINIIPAMIYFCFTQDNCKIPCPLDPEKSSPIIKNADFCHVERSQEEQEESQEEQDYKPA